MKVFELAKKLSRTSKEILSAAGYLQINVKSHLSNLTEQEVNKIIKYFKKKRILFWFKKYFFVFFVVLILIMVFIVTNTQTAASGEIYGSVNQQGELTLDWSFESPVEEGVILVESESELLIVEVDENNGSLTECCFQEDLAILLLFTDDDDDIVEVESVNITLPNTDVSSTITSILQTTSTSTSTTIAECNEDDFVPYTLYDSEGNGNTVLTCRNEQDAIDSGYTYTINPKPVTTTTLAPTTTSTSTTTTLASPTLSLLIDQIPKSDKLVESSSCKKIKKGNNKGKYKFEYIAKLTSESKAHEYTFSYKINNKKWKNWNKRKFKPIGKKHLIIKVRKTITKPKSSVNNFAYKFKYRPIGVENVTETDVFTVQENIPCTKTGVTKSVVPLTTTTTFNSENSDIKFTDEVEVRATTTTLAPTTTSTTSTSSTTSTTTTTLPECNDEDFQPYTLYDSDGNANTVLTCRNEQDALNLNYSYTVNPNPPPAPSPTTTTSTTTTTLPSSINISTGETYITSCAYGVNPAGTRTYGKYFTNNESQTIYVQHTNSMTTALSIGPGATKTISTYGATHGTNSRQYKVAFTQAGLSDVEFITRNFNLDCQPDIDITHSLASCAGNKGSRTRVSSLNFTNNESETAYVNTRYSTNGGSSWSSISSVTVSAGATVSGPDSTVLNGYSIIWQSHKSVVASSNVSFSDSDYYTENTSNTIDCPDGYYVNVDGSNTYSLTLSCKKWKNSTKPLFQANPWWGSYSTAKSYMFALIALTGDYDDSDSNVEESDYFDYSPFQSSSSNCFGIVNAAYFAYEISNDQWMGAIIEAPQWNSTTNTEAWDRTDHEQYVFAELVP